MRKDFVADKSHSCWYIKIPLDEDLSLRYYFLFEDRKELERRWILKSHSKKRFGTISDEAAELLRERFGANAGEYEEIISRRLPNGVYVKTVVKRKSDEDGEKAEFPRVKIMYELDGDARTVCDYAPEGIEIAGGAKKE